ncbi:GntR family transcriptional regulator [Aquipuribacter sp. MA13-6]|uniref:GntR family transcriptional regulator n=1 Tax=unclassified Aquipuribacter TaxID=2635084 RepID=UPI003EEFCB56
MDSTDRTTTVDSVRTMILRGDYAPGARLGEVELAQALGVSRTPVREALRRLSAEGLVDITPNKGARVVDFSPEDLEHVFVLRAHVEGLSARLAAARISDAQLDELQASAEQMAAHALPGPDQDLDLVYGLNARFHALVVGATGSNVLPGVVDSLVHTGAVLRTLHGFDDDAMRRSTQHHLEIVAALRAHDGLWAESVMRSHLMSARASLLGPRRQPADPLEPE